MAATIGNFASGDVLTAAQMNTLGLEFLDDQEFNGYGGVASNVLSGDFSQYMVSFYGKLGTSSSALYWRFQRGGSELSTSNYNYSTTYSNMTGGAPGNLYSTNSSNIRLGAIDTNGAMLNAFITLGYNNRAMVTFQSMYGKVAQYVGAGQFYDGTAVTGFKIYRTANLTDMRVKVYGLRN